MRADARPTLVGGDLKNLGIPRGLKESYEGSLVDLKESVLRTI